MNLDQLRRDYRRVAKPRAVEEVGDIYLIRPLGFGLVELFRRTPLTPTMVSVLAVLAGWWSAWYYFASGRQGMVPALAALGAVAVLLHSALDSADGQLARLKQLHTPLGRIIDGFCDNLFFAGVYAAILLGHWSRAPEHQLAILVLALLASSSHSLQAALVEFQRSLYLEVVHGRGSAIGTDPSAAPTAGRGIGTRLLHELYRGYHRKQRFWLRSTARLERFLGQWARTHPGLAGELADRYESSHRPLLPWWALLASNSHKAAIIVAAFLPVGSGSFWASLGLGWVFVYNLALNLVVVALIPAQARADRRLEEELRALAPLSP